MRNDVKEALRLALSRGFQLSPEAIKYLERQKDPVSILSRALREIPEDTIVISKKLLEIPRRVDGQLISAKEVEDDVRIIKKPEDCHVIPTFEGFLRCFIDRYWKLYKIFRDRRDIKSITPIGELHSKSKVTVVGLVTQKQKLASGAYLLEIEDPSGHLQVLVPQKPNIVNKLEDILLDTCIAVTGFYSNGRLVAEDVSLPEVSPPRIPEDIPPISALLLSDLHVGSALFLEKHFNKLINWLKGKGSPETRKLALSIKYVIIAGDLVDGVGIYPKQEVELKIKDMEKQYEKVADILSAIPDYIKLIVIPGNHDATIPALPYYSFLEEYAYHLRDLPNVIIAGDPTLISLHGVNLLVSHGRSLDDVIASIPGTSFTPEGISKAMRCLIRCRHLSPIYGSKTPIAPIGKDYMVVEEVPHILHMGHVHIVSISRYKGILLVNSGTWQAQTNYQFSMGITPTPCRVPIIRLNTLQVTLLDFS